MLIHCKSLKTFLKEKHFVALSAGVHSLKTWLRGHGNKLGQLYNQGRNFSIFGEMSEVCPTKSVSVTFAIY